MRNLYVIGLTLLLIVDSKWYNRAGFGFKIPAFLDVSIFFKPKFTILMLFSSLNEIICTFSNHFF